MTLRAHIKRGAVVLDEPTTLPDGTAVEVRTIAPPAPAHPPEPGPTLYERLRPIIGKATGLPAFSGPQRGCMPASKRRMLSSAASVTHGTVENGNRVPLPLGPLPALSLSKGHPLICHPLIPRPALRPSKGLHRSRSMGTVLAPVCSVGTRRTG